MQAQAHSVPAMSLGDTGTSPLCSAGDPEMGTALSARAGADVCPQQWLWRRPCPPSSPFFTFRRKAIPITQCLNLSLGETHGCKDGSPATLPGRGEGTLGSAACSQLSQCLPNPEHGCCDQTAKWPGVTQWKMHLMASHEPSQGEGFKGKAGFVCCFVASLFSSWVKHRGDQG